MEATRIWAGKYYILFSYAGSYSHFSNSQEGWNKRGVGAKVAKSINMEVGIKVEGGIFWEKLIHKYNKRGVERGLNLRNQ